MYFINVISIYLLFSLQHGSTYGGNPLASRVAMASLQVCNTIYILIFEGCNFRKQSKFRTFTVLFSKIICYQPLSSICIVIVLKKFEDLIFADDKLPTKTAKITSLENLYVCGMIILPIN